MRPRDVIEAAAPDPNEIGKRYVGQTCAGTWVKGRKDGREREVYLYQVADNQECVALYGTQGVVAQTAFPGVIALELLATGKLAGYKGNPEAGVFPAQAFTCDDFVAPAEGVRVPRRCARDGLGVQAGARPRRVRRAGRRGRRVSGAAGGGGSGGAAARAACRRFEGKVALVTGGASGIGLATAERLLEEGAAVVIADLDGDAAEAAAAALRDRGLERAEAARCDVTRGDQVQALVADVVARHGRLDVLFNNAGIFEPGEVHEVDEEAWDRQLGVNLRVRLPGPHHVVPVMLAQGGGAIVNNASVAALVGDHDAAAYCASKGGVGAAHQGDGARLRRARHPRQRHLLRRDRHAAVRARVVPDRHDPRLVPRSCSTRRTPSAASACPPRRPRRSHSWPATTRASSPACCCRSTAATRRQ